MSSLRPFGKFAVRDLLVLGVVALAWVLDGRLRTPSEASAFAPLVAVVAGLSATLLGFFCHEWGHLLGAVLAGGKVHAPRRVYSPFLFFFDSARSDRRAFLWMSYGGYLASATSLAAIMIWVPWETLSGRVALVTAGLGVLVTFGIEVPTTVRVARGGMLPRGGVFADEKGHPSAESLRSEESLD